jgi:hypothetical protein
MNKLAFQEWMLKIGNIYYSNDKLMARALNKINDYAKPRI